LAATGLAVLCAGRCEQPGRIMMRWMRGRVRKVARLVVLLPDRGVWWNAVVVADHHDLASQMAERMDGSRLESLLLALDEVTQIVPIPLPSIVADSGGRGIQLIIAAHSIA
jgi:hypothetical protein